MWVSQDHYRHHWPNGSPKILVYYRLKLTYSEIVIIITNSNYHQENAMLLTIDKRGSINIPLAVRRELGLDPGSNLDLTIDEGGRITLHPVVIYRTMRISKQGQAKIKAARASGSGELPEWLCRDMQNADPDTDQ
jgi:AbrB family looped-hinge helix DNA binding protein